MPHTPRHLPPEPRSPLQVQDTQQRRELELDASEEELALLERLQQEQQQRQQDNNFEEFDGALAPVGVAGRFFRRVGGTKVIPEPISPPGANVGTFGDLASGALSAIGAGIRALPPVVPTPTDEPFAEVGPVDLHGITFGEAEETVLAEPSRVARAVMRKLDPDQRRAFEVLRRSGVDEETAAELASQLSPPLVLGAAEFGLDPLVLAPGVGVVGTGAGRGGRLTAAQAARSAEGGTLRDVRAGAIDVGGQARDVPAGAASKRQALESAREMVEQQLKVAREQLQKAEENARRTAWSESDETALANARREFLEEQETLEAVRRQTRSERGLAPDEVRHNREILSDFEQGVRDLEQRVNDLEQRKAAATGGGEAVLRELRETVAKGEQEIDRLNASLRDTQASQTTQKAVRQAKLQKGKRVEANDGSVVQEYNIGGQTVRVTARGGRNKPNDFGQTGVEETSDSRLRLKAREKFAAQERRATRDPRQRSPQRAQQADSAHVGKRPPAPSNVVQKSLAQQKAAVTRAARRRVPGEVEALRRIAAAPVPEGSAVRKLASDLQNARNELSAAQRSGRQTDINRARDRVARLEQQRGRTVLDKLAELSAVTDDASPSGLVDEVGEERRFGRPAAAKRAAEQRAEWEQAQQTGGTYGYESSLRGFKRRVEEIATDRFAGINRETAAYRQIYEDDWGAPLPHDLDAEMAVSLFNGAPHAGVERAKELWRTISREMGSDIPFDDLNLLLQSRHAINVFEQLGAKRRVVGPFGSIKEARDVEQFLRRKHAGTERMIRLERAASAVRDEHADILRRKVEVGMVAPELAHVLRSRYPWYNPIRYAESLVDGDPVEFITGQRKPRGTAGKGLARLGEMGADLATVAPLDTLGGDIVKAERLIARNRALKAIAHVFDLRDAPPPPGRGVRNNSFSWMEDGERFTRNAPDWLADEVKFLEYLPSVNNIERFLRTALRSLNAVSQAGFTGLSMPFFIANFAVDSLTGYITQGILPHETASALVRNMRALVKDDPVLSAKSMAGGDVSGFFGKTDRELLDRVARDGNLAFVAGQGQTGARLREVLSDPLELVSRLGHAVEEAPRRAVFEKRIKNGASIEEAAFASRRGTVDFQRSGVAVGYLNAVALYLNAGIQGTILPFRALRAGGRDVTVNSQRAAMRLGGFMSLVGAIYAYNRQYPEWEDVPAYVKHGSLTVMLPSREWTKEGRIKPHYVSIIPAVREWGFFSGALTYTLDRLTADFPVDTGRFLETWTDNFNPLGTVTGQSNLPITQVGSASVQTMMNKDMFRGRDIVPDEMKFRPLEEQVFPSTSKTAARVGPAIGVSPLKIDFYVRNTMGTLGEQLFQITDSIDELVTDPDPVIRQHAEQLHEIRAPQVPADRVAVERTEFITDLPADIKEAVLLEEGRIEREDELMLIDPILRRFVREGGGELERTARNALAEEMGLDDEQTREVAQKLFRLRNNPAQDTAQEEADWAIAHKDSTGFTGAQWREVNSATAAASRAVLKSLQVTHPQAAQTQLDSPETFAQFNFEVNRALEALGGNVRGELLSDVWFSFHPEQGALPEQVDYRPLHVREEWFQSLDPADQRLLEENIAARQSDVQEQYWADQRALSDPETGYFSIPDRVLANHPDLRETYYEYIRLPGENQRLMRAQRPDLAAALLRIDQEREQHRLSHPEQDAALTLWHDMVPIRSHTKFQPNLSFSSRSAPNVRRGGPSRDRRRSVQRRRVPPPPTGGGFGSFQ